MINLLNGNIIVANTVITQKLDLTSYIELNRVRTILIKCIDFLF